MKRTIIILALATVVALPFLLRTKRASQGKADDTVVIITPHNEAIRHEYGLGFADWYHRQTGRTVTIDWRVIGGTSEITRFLESEYVASFQHYWTRTLNRPWSVDVQAAFANHRLPKDASTEAQEARKAYLDSNVSCGIDVFFGGGSFDFIRQANAGRIVDSGIMQKHPEWFNDHVIPAEFTGEPYLDKQGRWLGAVLSSYGMLYNFDSLKRLGIAQPPQQWEDIADPLYEGEVALCDPTKSSSIAKAFENVIQQQIYREWDRLARETGKPRKELEAAAVRAGWERGLSVLQRIGANARYFTDSSQKPPIDVLHGNSAVGMCIDFYGRYQEESASQRSGQKRLGYFSPPDGTVLSPDPIALMRGAPNRVPGTAFIEYVLSMEGQQLWNFKVGTEGGPQRFALRRLPIRRDFYAQTDWQERRSDPEVHPYEGDNPLIYNQSWTSGDTFRAMAFVIRVMCLDTHPELVRAWREIIKAGMPADAIAAMSDLSTVSYDNVQGRIRQALTAKNKVDEIRIANELANQFRRQYNQAAELARASRK
ncbi:MAG: ABC transporter substrate-binding protein [Candidatus Didemnitutus sp.]|nr:ABC transporter substrate-binding protein [Candidatus Didemnitutus sp.]